MKKTSIFSLRKTKLEDAFTTEIRTVNFQNDEIKDINIKNYFNSRIKFLSASYNFAKEAKLEKDYDFKDGSETQLKLESWLENNQQASMITGSEFGVITTKVIESITSIQKNTYLKSAQEKLKEVVWSRKNNTDIKPSKTDLKNLEVSLNDIQNLSQSDIRLIFNYELIYKIKVIDLLLQEIKKKEILQDQIQNCEKYLSEFIEYASKAWENAFERTNTALKEKESEEKQLLDYTEFFVLKLYFAFDIKIREIEDDLLQIINLELNSIIQSFAQELLSKDNFADLDEISIKNLNSKLQNIWCFDWAKQESVNQFSKLVELILSGVEIPKDAYPKAGDDLFLAHPKSAPSFPSLKEKTVRWDKELATSFIFNENNKYFNSLKFADYLLFRTKKIIEGSDVYKMWRFLTSKADFEWSNWLLNIIENKIEFNLDDVNFESKIKVKEFGKVRTVEFIFELEKPNKNLPHITISAEKNSVSVKNVLVDWIKKHYLDLSKFNIEIALLREIGVNNELDKNFVNEWISLLNSEDGLKNKLATRTENRLKKLIELKINPEVNTEKLLDILDEKLSKVEKHLLLDQNHDEFKIFDKLSFDKYKKLSQIVFEACFVDKKDIVDKKAELAKLSLETQQVLPIKISRMTSNKPNGKSTLIFDINLETFELNKADSKVLIYPVNMGLNNGAEVKIVDSLDIALREFSRIPEKYSKICTGFLNGNADNFAEKTVNKVNKKDGTEGQFTTFGEWTITDSRLLNSVVTVEDKYRKIGETVVGTNPPGYPQLYFFLIPKVCNNLIIPVKTSDYYLGKYTPYNHLAKYLKLEKELFELQQSENQQEIINKVEQILNLRTFLRSCYRLSSIELDLIRDYKLNIDKANKKAVIESILKAKVHFQFGNPRKIYNLSESTEVKPKHILSVDLGEKHLAVATLSEVDWDKWEAGEFKLSYDKENYFLKPTVQTFLPLGHTDFTYVLEKNITKIDVNRDKFWNKYTSLIARYKSQQKQFGVVQDHLANSKANLTDKLAEQIAVQLVKIAHKHNAIVVFEDLAPGFGRQVETVRLYTQIRRLTAQKLGEVGLLETSFVKSEADLDKYSRYEFDRGLYSIINPSFTSKTCSCCGFVPVAYKERISKKSKETTIIDGVKINSKSWREQHKIEFSWKNKVFFTVIAPENNIKSWQIFDINNQNIKPTLERFQIYGSKRKPQLLLEATKDWLFTEKEGKPKEKIKDEFLKFAISNLFKPRQSQADYICPFCGNSQNADYQASYNIGLHFLIGNKIVEERKTENQKSTDLKKDLVVEIRSRLS